MLDKREYRIGRSIFVSILDRRILRIDILTSRNVAATERFRERMGRLSPTAHDNQTKPDTEAHAGLRFDFIRRRR